VFLKVEVTTSNEPKPTALDEALVPTEDGVATTPELEGPTLAPRRRLRRLYWRAKWLLVLLTFAVVVFIFRDRMLVTVDTGEVLVVYYRLFGGTQHNQIGREGLHILAPWDKSYRYVVRSQTLIQSVTVLSRNGLEVSLDAQIRFHPIPDMVPHLHRRFGPDYVTAFVTPQLKAAIQQVVGQFLAEEVYGSETGASVSRMFENTRQMIGGEFLEVEDVTLSNIKLPEHVQQAIQNKVEAQQQALAASYRVDEEQQETRRKLEEARGLQEYAKLASGIPRSVLIWKGIQATEELAKSPNAKIVVIGSKGELPLLLGTTPEVK
jgi:prohibitin 1